MGVIFIPGKCFVDVEEDEYEKGCTGSFCNSWDFDVHGVYKDKESLIEAINKSTCLDVRELYFMEGSIRFSVMVDADNTPPSECQFERWEKGEEKLYAAYGYMSVLYLPDFPHDMTEEEAVSFGLSLE